MAKSSGDTPSVQYSIPNIRKKVKKAELLRMSLSGSKIITFPDLYAQDSQEAEELMDRIDRDAGNWKLLEEWLSEADVKALKAEHLSLIELSTVIRTATKYYEDFYGDKGEGDASES